MHENRLVEAAAITDAAVYIKEQIKARFNRLADKLRTPYIQPPCPYNLGEPMKTMFEQVSEMNEAFGNPIGDPTKIQDQREAHLRQCQNIGSEFQELMKAFGFVVEMEFRRDAALPPWAPVDVDAARDALCDIMVFALGAFHRMGIDAERDMTEVVDAVMTRFCADPGQLTATVEKYEKAGVKFEVLGNFPRVFLRSAMDQQMPEYPKGKFLKSVGYRTPNLYALPVAAPEPVAEPTPPPAPPARKFFGQEKAKTEVSVTEQMAQQRAETSERFGKWKSFKEAKLAELLRDLEQLETEDALVDKLLEGEVLLTFTLGTPK
jgi:Phosphoribosyl-ATP pyrophosphohydrolase